eukprot:6664121-Prymnesium_polylepis.2
MPRAPLEQALCCHLSMCDRSVPTRNDSHSPPRSRSMSVAPLLTRASLSVPAISRATDEQPDPVAKTGARSRCRLWRLIVMLHGGPYATHPRIA